MVNKLLFWQQITQNACNYCSCAYPWQSVHPFMDWHVCCCV